jgi:hypothetical protein
VIIKEEIVDVQIPDEKTNNLNGSYEEICSKAIFFDLEHYVYKKPKCVGVFGVCTYNQGKLKVTQYMIEDNRDVKEILLMGKEYFKKCERDGKKYIVTFSGNNDFLVINYLFNKFSVDYDISDKYTHIDIQREYEKLYKTSIGLKALEKEFDILRESQLISGSTLAKTFSKLMKDDCYIKRIPKEKIKKILLIMGRIFF